MQQNFCPDQNDVSSVLHYDVDPAVWFPCNVVFLNLSFCLICQEAFMLRQICHLLFQFVPVSTYQS